jgi:hypothetical protein
LFTGTRCRASDYLQALQAFPQAADTAGMVHENRYPFELGGAYRPVTCLMRDLVGKDHDTLRFSDLGAHTLLVLTEYLNIHPLTPCLHSVLIMQSIHAANQYNIHNPTSCFAFTFT